MGTNIIKQATARFVPYVSGKINPEQGFCHLYQLRQGGRCNGKPLQACSFWLKSLKTKYRNSMESALPAFHRFARPLQKLD